MFNTLWNSLFNMNKQKFDYKLREAIELELVKEISDLLDLSILNDYTINDDDMKDIHILACTNNHKLFLKLVSLDKFNFERYGLQCFDASINSNSSETSQYIIENYKW